jgi:sugar lactone lactonase YvrE
MKAVLLLLLFILPIKLVAQTLTVQDYFKKAREARQAGDSVVHYAMIMEAFKLHPYHPGILYEAAAAATLNSKDQEALQFLKQVILVKANADLDVPVLAPLKKYPEFQKLRELQIQLQKQVIHSDTAFIVPDRTLHVESLTPGESSGGLYLGSIHKKKIVQVDKKGKLSDFTTSGQGGLTAVFSVKADHNKKILWACASPMKEMEHFDSTAQSAVFKYDLRTKKLLRKFGTDTPEKECVFGDLTLDPSGKVFISDSKNNIIFSVSEVTGRLESFFTSTEFWNLQGITFSADGRYLFIADYVKGLYRLEMSNKELIALTKTFDLSTKSIDGLLFYDNSLICIQNSIYPMRVTRYFLNETKDKLIRYAIIDNAHPAFNEPTTGCISGDYFYYIANSLWSGYLEDHSLKPYDQLQEPVILKIDLRKIN